MTPLVAILLNSNFDWDIMQSAELTLGILGIPREVKIISAHKTPEQLFEYSQAAEDRGLQVIIASASQAAHLPGMIAALTLLPVIGVPMVSANTLNGLDALLSISQMPMGIPVATMSLGKEGATNAALFAAQILAGRHPNIKAALREYRLAQTKKILDNPDPAKK